MVWQETQEPATTIIRWQDNEKTVERTAPFAQTIQAIAAEWGLAAYSVYADGQEITSPTSAPRDFTGISEVELVKYGQGA